ncbi:hypothetical protein AWJ20_4636 [Sugiyamaella lignohabitans]|uniref:COP9 signalosome complex subunit 3 N-terminal helical repeats domain-containing protein n=1 Tax=Sugiyamaella lignohabitans TaxID=796027 RepID=A0A167E681_9ASCO|nr:uncharacterized protein AWJ20_4636 [Sugiyamaella lignohabitans]ANB13693.1 hypothetical protein AWJ20_4636 [Sugiyamaella lignohabitans]
MTGDSSSDVLDVVNQLRAKENDLTFVASTVVPVFMSSRQRFEKLQPEIIEAIVNTPVSTYTVPWIFALWAVLENESLSWRFVQLFRQFMTSFRADHARLAGFALAELLERIDSTGSSEYISPPYAIGIATGLRRGVGKLNHEVRGESDQRPLELSRLHSSLAYWSVISKRYIFAKDMLAPTNRYVRPAKDYPISQIDVLFFHYYSSIVLIAEKRYFQAAQYLTVVLNVPTVDERISSDLNRIQCDLRIASYAKWVCISLLHSGHVPSLSNLISDELVQSIRKHCEEYDTLSTLLRGNFHDKNMATSLEAIQEYINTQSDKFANDDNLDLVQLCFEKYKRDYVRTLQTKVSSSMSIDYLDSRMGPLNPSQKQQHKGKLTLNTRTDSNCDHSNESHDNDNSDTGANNVSNSINESVYDYVNNLILSGQTDGEYKLLDAADKPPHLISTEPTSKALSHMNQHMLQMIDSIINTAQDLDATMYDLVASGKFRSLLSKLSSKRPHLASVYAEFNEESLGDGYGGLPSQFGLAARGSGQINIPGLEAAMFGRRRPDSMNQIQISSGTGRRRGPGTIKSSARRRQAAPRMRQGSNHRSRHESTGSASSSEDAYDPMERDSENDDSTES